jgi:CheY-like chemotaxis protein
LRAMFEAAGILCTEAENGAQAVEQAEQLRPDLVVLDFSMPVMNGLEAARLLRRRLPQTPIIMFTLFASKALEKLAVPAGVTVVIPKEQAASQLIPQVQSLLNSLPD